LLLRCLNISVAPPVPTVSLARCANKETTFSIATYEFAWRLALKIEQFKEGLVSDVAQHASLHDDDVLPLPWGAHTAPVRLPSTSVIKLGRYGNEYLLVLARLVRTHCVPTFIPSTANHRR
jgi:hypothetical protein